MSQVNFEHNLIKSQPSAVDNSPTTYFQCECGKSYLNYPALYLHFQRKHNQTISTKMENSKCEVTEKDNHKVITYFYTHLDEKSDLDDPLKVEWETSINQFMDVEAENQALEPPSRECLQSLKGFIRGLEKKTIHNGDELSRKELPEFFNQFMVEKSGVISPILFFKWCETLIKFSKWLFDNKFSKKIVEKNQEFHL